MVSKIYLQPKQGVGEDWIFISTAEIILSTKKLEILAQLKKKEQQDGQIEDSYKKKSNLHIYKEKLFMPVINSFLTCSGSENSFPFADNQSS